MYYATRILPLYDPPYPNEGETAELEYHTSTDVPIHRENYDLKLRVHSFLMGREIGGNKPVFLG